MGERTTGIICREDTGHKEVVQEPLHAVVISGHRLGTTGSLTRIWSTPMPLLRSQSNPEGLRLERRTRQGGFESDTGGDWLPVRGEALIFWGP